MGGLSKEVNVNFWVGGSGGERERKREREREKRGFAGKKEDSSWMITATVRKEARKSSPVYGAIKREIAFH